MKKHLETCSHAEFERAAAKVSMVSIIGHLILSVLKALAGVIAHSGAMISDAVHSASDVFSTFVVMIGIKISARASDKEHPYGHERMECVAAIVLATILCITGLGIGKNAIAKLQDGNDAGMVIPGILALVAAIVSIVVKEAMFWYTRGAAKKIDSGALMADAWHHRSDALSSVGALVGILFARNGYPVMDVVASLIICVFIVKASYDIFKDAVDKMVDKACDEETERELKNFVEAQPGVLGVDLLQTRVFGNKIYVDLEIGADENSTLTDSPQVAEQVPDHLEIQFPKVKHIMIHENPASASAE